MNAAVLPSIMATGFGVTFSHAAIPTHWLPFVLAERGQRCSHGKTLAVTAYLVGAGHGLDDSFLNSACDGPEKEFGLRHCTLQIEAGDRASRLAPAHVV